MEKVILGLDQSTSGTKLIIVNQKGHIIYKESIGHKQYYPEPGYVEHDMKEVLQHCLTMLAKGIEFTKDRYIIENLSITKQS
jgi:glycerol kinase